MIYSGSKTDSTLGAATTVMFSPSPLPWPPSGSFPSPSTQPSASLITLPGVCVPGGGGPHTECALSSCTSGATSGLKKCGQCKAVSYCSQECQKADWRSHKAVCVPQGAGRKDEAAASSTSGFAVSSAVAAPAGSRIVRIRFPVTAQVRWDGRAGMARRLSLGSSSPDSTSDVILIV